MDSIREQIIKALVTRLETMLVSNGYNFDTGTYIERTVEVLDEYKLPGCSVWAGIESVTLQYGNEKRVMVVDIEGHLIDDKTNPHDQQANLMIADFQKCLGTYDLNLMNLIESIQETTTEPIYPDSGSNIISVRSTYEVTYMTVKGNPYLQP